MECTVYSMEEEELGRSTESASGDSQTVTYQNEIEQINDLFKLKPRSLCDRRQFEETQNPEFDIVEYSNPEQTTSLVSSFYHSEYRI
jgi:hypothetical protein